MTIMTRRRGSPDLAMAESSAPDAERLVAMAEDARLRTLETVEDLDDEHLIGPQLAIVNPPLWEIGHVGWFWEFFSLRYRGEGNVAPSRFPAADSVYNSAAITHDDRWRAQLLSREETFAYLRAVLDRTLERLRIERDERTAYFAQLATFHEDMHGEAFLWTRQTHGLAFPPIAAADLGARDGLAAGPLPGDAEVPGGTFRLGAERDAPFVFDNEKWAHAVELEPFRIARAPVTNAELAAFVEDGGYSRRELWSEEGWAWRSDSGAELPLYWSRSGTGDWQVRRFDRTLPLRSEEPAMHVNWFEADAFCRWAGRRLPSEAEWEAAAAAEPANGGLAERKRAFPWGEPAPVGEGFARANLDARLGGPVDVAAFAAGDSVWGCRQMIGNVWEWCADDFGPYPGFEPGAYREYSEPWFGDHKTARGGSWATRGRMLRNTWRNFAKPDRRDLFFGFRTCAPRAGE